MKKLMAAVLAVLCLAGCSAKTEKAPEVGVSEVVRNEPAPQQEEKPVENIEIEIEEPAEEPLPEDLPAEEGGSMAVPVEAVEGLVGDAVGYSFQKPVFTDYAAAETMNAFYEELVNGLEVYANGTVNDKCLKENCVASVYGTVLQATLTGDTLDVRYECRVEYSGEVEGTVNVRVDTWNIQTGEVTSDVG